MRLAATARGAGVPEGGFAGTVEHVYPRVCLLGLSDQTLLTLATSVVGHLPRGITLAPSPNFLLHSHVAPGGKFVARGGIVRFPGSTFCVDLRSSCRFRCDLAALHLDIKNAAVLHAWQTARTVLRRDGRSLGLQQAAGAAIRNIAVATRGLARDAASEAVSTLVGLGEGATPAGDDFLVGYVAGLLSSTGTIDARTNFALALCKHFSATASRTNRVSRVYLEAAAEGQISERLYALAIHIAAGAEAETVALAVQAALAVGHTSGACGVFGLLLGCAAWDGTMWTPNRSNP
jgi:Protein of unknown function (DUF2877)